MSDSAFLYSWIGCVLAGILILSWQTSRIQHAINELLDQQQLLLSKENQIMASVQNVLDAIAQFKTDLSAAIAKELGEISAQITALKTSSNGAATSADLDNIINSLSAAKATLTSQVDAISEQDGTVTPNPAPNPPNPNPAP